ncbi:MULTISPECIES: ParA family protein [unclassified Streptomyces]|uniref:ParA family protein n=1 Tax=unclassified Streptomyces TaxID=2593676 RepID=UPI00382BDEA8
MGSRRVAAGNNKGGSGKTAWVVNTAAALADAGRRVLVVDMDPQANASRRLGRPYREESPTVTTADVLRDAETGSAVDGIVPCAWDGVYGMRIDILPSRFDLEKRVAEAAVIGARSRLVRALEGADDQYDVTLIDCPPSLGHLTELALAAAHYGIALIDPEFDGVQGATRLRDFMQDEQTRRELANMDLQFLAAIPSRIDNRVGAHLHHVSTLPSLFGQDLVWEPIPERATVKNAADAALPLSSEGARAADIRAVYADNAERLWKAIG